MKRQTRPTTTGAIIIGRMKSVRSTDMPRMLRSSRSARPTPSTISTVTTVKAKIIVTQKLSWKAGSPSSLT